MRLRKPVVISLGISMFIVLFTACSGKMAIDAAPNQPPDVKIYTPATVQSGDIIIEYDILDPEGDTCWINVDFKGGTADDTWTSASVSGTLTVYGAGEDLQFIWLSNIDQPNHSDDNYRIRITPGDLKNTGIANKTDFFSVHNNTDGQIKWSYRTHDGIFKAPALSPEGGTIYFLSGHNRLYAVDPDGSLLWNSTAPIGPFYAFTVSPAGTIYFADGTGNVCAYDNTGLELWSKHFGAEVGEGQVSLSPDGGTIYFETGTTLWAVDPGDGDNIYWKNSDFIIGGLSPVFNSSGTMFFSKRAELMAMDPGGNVYWSRDLGNNLTIGLIAIAPDDTMVCKLNSGHIVAIRADGTIKWDVNPPYSVTPWFAIAPDGTIYCHTATREFLALDPDNGNIRWEYYLDKNATQTPLVCADGSVIFTSKDANALIALDSNGNERWTCKFPDMIHEPSCANDGTVFVGCEDYRLYAVSDSNGGPAASGWPAFMGSMQHSGVQR